jgi:two-component system, NarL family, sensor kinase
MNGQEEELLESSRRIIRAQELEHRWVARELHDSVNQILSSAKFRLLLAEKRPSGAVFSQEVEKARSLVEMAIHEIRRISQNLRPTLLDDFGLLAALKSLCEDFEERTGTPVELKAARFTQGHPSETEVTLYRIVQEALNNIEKHSGATKAAIWLFEEADRFELRVKDNGKGFNSVQAQSRKSVRSGLGLTHIKERAIFVGGRAEILSAPGKGTEIRVSIPLKRRAMDRRNNEKSKVAHR